MRGSDYESETRIEYGGNPYEVVRTYTRAGEVTSAVIYADSVTTEGQITFHCEETPTEALKVSIMKIKVEG